MKARSMVTIIPGSHRVPRTSEPPTSSTCNGVQWHAPTGHEPDDRSRHCEGYTGSGQRNRPYRGNGRPPGEKGGSLTARVRHLPHRDQRHGTSSLLALGRLRGRSRHHPSPGREPMARRRALPGSGVRIRTSGLRTVGTLSPGNSELRSAPASIRPWPWSLSSFSARLAYRVPSLGFSS